MLLDFVVLIVLGVGTAAAVQVAMLVFLIQCWRILNNWDNRLNNNDIPEVLPVPPVRNR